MRHFLYVLVFLFLLFGRPVATGTGMYSHIFLMCFYFSCNVFVF